MARRGFSAASRALLLLAPLWAASQIAMGCDLIAGIHTINPNDPPAGGTGGSSGAEGAHDSGVCSPEALSCSACAECHEVVSIIIDAFSTPTAPALTLTGSLAGENRTTPRVTFECKHADGPERVYALYIEKDGFLTAKLSRAGTAFDSVLYARKSCCGAFDPTTQCNDSSKAEGDHSSLGGEVISFRVTKGEVWYLFVDGSDSAASGSYTLDLGLTSGVGCAAQGWVPITVEPGSAMKLSGTTSGLGTKGVNRCFLNHIEGVGTASEVIYELRAPTDVAAFGLSLNGTFDTVLYARSACIDASDGDKSELTCVDENTGVGGEFIQSLPNKGSPLYVFVDTGPLIASSYEYTLIITPK